MSKQMNKQINNFPGKFQCSSWAIAEILLYHSSAVSEIYFGMHLYLGGLLTMVSSKQTFFFFFLTYSSSPSNFTAIANNIIVSGFSIFLNMI